MGDREEVEAFCGFLRAASTIQFVGGRKYCPGVALELFLNFCGRYLLGSSRGIPLSVWPLVLATIQYKSYRLGFREFDWATHGLDKPTALFYFLRKSPIFATL